MNNEFAKLQVIYLDGDAPVQALGYIDGYPFYFHARGRRWRFAVASARTSTEEAIKVAAGEATGFLLTRKYGRSQHDASILSYSIAMSIIRRAAQAFLAYCAKQ